MPLETGTYISDLVTSNPAASDPLSNADDHVRLVKATIKATFPNVTGAINSTNAAIDATVTSVAAGASVLADAGAFYKTNATDGFTNPAAGEIDLKLAGTIAARFLNTAGALSLALPGSLTTVGPITGPGIVPVGGMIMWLSDTLPSVGSWCWANGGVLSRTGNGAALWALWGNTSPFGLGDGTTTFNVINLQEVVPVGKSGMGGATSPGLLASISSGLKGVLGGLFGADTVTLTAAEIPSLTSSGNNSISVSGTNFNPPATNVGTFAGSGSTGIFGWSTGQNPVTSTFTNSAQAISVAYANGSQQATPNTQPTRAVNFIIRIG